MKEYTIHNNHKHDETNKRVTHQGEEITALKEAVKANTKISSFWYTVRKYSLYFIAAAIAAFGGLWANHYWVETHKPEIVIDENH